MLARARGLLGTKRDWGAGNRVLVIMPCRSVHTFGMRYAIDIAFANRRGIVLRALPNVGPGRILRAQGAYFVLERPSMPGVEWFDVQQRIQIELAYQPLSFIKRLRR